MGPVVNGKRVKPSKSPKSANETEQPLGVDSEKRSIERFKANRGVLFIKSIPHGFLEWLLRTYFQQFGSVTRVRLALKNGTKRRGGSKGHAFVEFKVPQVAKIASDTMNVIKFKEVLTTTYIPPKEQRTNHFRGNKLSKQTQNHMEDPTGSELEEDFNTNSSENETSSDRKKINSRKQLDGKALLYKLANEMLDENDSSDDDFQIDHSFNASDDESSSTSGDSLTSKLKRKKQSASHNTSNDYYMTDSSDSESGAIETYKMFKKTTQAGSRTTNELKRGGKRKRATNNKMNKKVSASSSWVSSVESEEEKKRTKKSKRVKLAESTFESDAEEVVMPLVVRKKKSKVISSSDEEVQQVKPKIFKIQKGKSGITKKMKKGPTKSGQVKIVKETPKELFTLSHFRSNRQPFTK